jgi:uncharacterized membrane protein
MNPMDEPANRSLYPWISSLLVLLPFGSALAAYLGFQDVLLIVFLVVGLCAFVAILRGGNLDDRLITTLVWSISLSLILPSTFLSSYLRGEDINDEYLVAIQTSTTGVWNPQQFNPYASVLSVAILPAMINSLSALSVVQIFKFVYPVIFSLVPVVVYKITRKIFAPGGAFLSAFLFMSYHVFYDGMLGLAREEIAETLLVLLLLVLLSTEIGKGASGKLLLILLMLGFAVSHYSLFYIFILVLVYSCLVSRRTGVLTLLALMLIVGLVWYTFTAGGAAIVGVGKAISFVSASLTNGGIFSLSSKPQDVLRAVGSAPLSPGPLQQANRWTQILVQLWLLLGFFVLMFKKKNAMEEKMFPLMTGGLIVLVSSIAVPGLAAALNFNRYYQLTLLFISPFFIYGDGLVEQALRSVGLLVENHRLPRLHTPTERNALHLAAAMLFLYFLFVSGWFTVVTAGTPTSLVLDANRMKDSTNPTVSEQYYAEYTDLPDISGAIWLHSHDIGGRPVCADINAQDHVLLAYGEFQGTSYLPDRCHFSNSFVYLDQFNNIYGVGETYNGTFRISELSQTLSNMNRVYSNSGVTIYA